MEDSESVFKFRLIIHTVQMLSETRDISQGAFERINKKSYIIKPRVRLCKSGCLFPINPNKFNGSEIESLSAFFSAIDDIQRDLAIPKWTFNRVDFAFDTPLKYDQIYKYSLYITSLLSEITGIKNAIDTRDVNTKKKRALTLKNKGFEFQIYDKALESDDKCPYTRLEFRFKNIRNADIYALADRLQALLESLSSPIKKVETQRINDLYEIWKKEHTAFYCSETKNFSEFVRRYTDDIFTRKMAKELYSKICGGTFNNWLKKFKRKNKIAFIGKSEIENIAHEMKIALDRYLH